MAILEELKASYEKTYGAGGISKLLPELTAEYEDLTKAQDRLLSSTAQLRTEAELRILAGEKESTLNVDLADEYADLADAQNELNKSTGQLKTPFEKYIEDLIKAKENADKLAEASIKLKESYMEMAITAAEGGIYELFYMMGEAAAGMDSAGESFSKFVQGLVSQMAKLFIVAGLQAIISGDPTKFWIGVGLLALGGVMALVGGAMSAPPAASASGGVEQTGLVHLASGGIVRRPTMALIGESGPEAVIPLGGGRTGGVTVNVYGSVWSGDNLARVIARQLQ
jgi:hypothetical protein